MDGTKTAARRDEIHSSFSIWCNLYYRFDSNFLDIAIFIGQPIPNTKCNDHRKLWLYTVAGIFRSHVKISFNKCWDSWTDRSYHLQWRFFFFFWSLLLIEFVSWYVQNNHCGMTSDNKPQSRNWPLKFEMHLKSEPTLYVFCLQRLWGDAGFYLH